MASAQNDLTLEAALASFDKTSIQSHVSEGAKERKQIAFPSNPGLYCHWRNMPLASKIFEKPIATSSNTEVDT
jgi:hypothetical protein